MVYQLAAFMYLIAFVVLTGVFMVIALVLGYDAASHMYITVALGALCAIPAAYFTANRLTHLTGK